MAPRPDLRALGLDLQADLHLTLDDGSRTASAHLTGGLDDLVLDVDHPVALLRAVPRRSLPDGSAAALGLLAGTSARVTSGGTTLGRVAVSATGRPRFVPSLAAFALPAKSAVASRNVRLIGSAALLLFAAVVATGRLRRR